LAYAFPASAHLLLTYINHRSDSVLASKAWNAALAAVVSDKNARTVAALTPLCDAARSGVLRSSIKLEAEGLDDLIVSSLHQAVSEASVQDLDFVKLVFMAPGKLLSSVLVLL
jgi:hypothetical protein